MQLKNNKQIKKDKRIETKYYIKSSLWVTYYHENTWKSNKSSKKKFPTEIKMFVREDKVVWIGDKGIKDFGLEIDL